MVDKKKICIVGSGNWGSVIAKIIGLNVKNSKQFEERVTMYVYEEMIDGKKLTEIINTQHENVKYLPGYTLPTNVVAVPDVVAAADGADILVFVVPHQFVRGLCTALTGKVKKNTLAVSLIKGIDINDGKMDLISNVIRKSLGIECAVLMGANIAPEVAREDFCEATIGCKNAVLGQCLKDCMQTPYFRIVVVDDEETVELCGALKNIVAVGAGFVDGLGMGGNTKAAVIRLGLMEMINFVKKLYPKSKVDTYLQSCGIADLTTTCFGGRNRKCAEAFVKTGKSIAVLEKEMLNGQSLQGPSTAAEVFVVLQEKGLVDKFPMFATIHKICIKELEPASFISCLQNHPEHMDVHPLIRAQQASRL